MPKVQTGKRITFKHTKPNPLFQEWLEVLYKEAKAEKSKLELTLKEAISSIIKYPLPLQSGTDCAILKGFDKRLCNYLNKCLDKHLSDSLHVHNHVNNIEVSKDNKSADPVEHIPVVATLEIEDVAQKMVNIHPITSSVQMIETIDITEEPVLYNSTSPITNTGPQLNYNQSLPKISLKNSKKTCTKKKENNRNTYKPSYQSGGYAILVALFKHSQHEPEKPCLNKEQLIDLAQKHSDESFTRPKPGSFYTAWSNMTRLITKGYVVKNKNKKVEYMLTDQGKVLAIELLNDSKNRPTANDLIFNCENEIELENEQHEVQNDLLIPPSILASSSNCNDLLVEMLPGSYEIILLIDKNETGGLSKKNDPTVAQFNKYPNLKHEYRSLKVGDFTWIARHKVKQTDELVLPYVVERKRMDDLGASIKDGRFHEQKFRLRKCGLKNVIYMIEHYGSNKHVGLPVQSLLQALANTRVQDGFKVHITDSLTSSARFLAIMTKRLTIEYKDRHLKGYNREPSGDVLMTFDYFNKSSAKTRTLTVTEMFIKILLQLKGVSVEKALAITNEYTTPSALIKAYKKCNEKEGHFLLANLKYGSLNRNVGPNLSKAIYQLFSNFNEN